MKPDPCLCSLLHDDPDLAIYVSRAVDVLIKHLGGGRLRLPPGLAPFRDLVASGDFQSVHCESCCATSPHESSLASADAEIGHAEDMGSLRTRREVALALRVSVATVDRWVADGRLPSFKLGHAVRFRAEDIQEFAAQRRTTKEAS